MRSTDLFESVCWFAAFIYSTSIHEAAHAWVAHRGGDSTAAEGGQVTLDPWPHIRREPVGMLLLPLITLFSNGWPIGWASAPYRVDWALKNPRACASMALAGPSANGLLAVAAFGLLSVGLMVGIFHPAQNPGFSHWVGARTEIARLAAVFLSIVLTMNMVLLLFNLLPFPPLDGASLPLFILPSSLTSSYFQLIHQPWISWIGAIIAWKASPILMAPAFSGLRSAFLTAG